MVRYRPRSPWPAGPGLPMFSTPAGPRRYPALSLCVGAPVPLGLPTGIQPEILAAPCWRERRDTRGGARCRARRCARNGGGSGRGRLSPQDRQVVFLRQRPRPRALSGPERVPTAQPASARRAPWPGGCPPPSLVATSGGRYRGAQRDVRMLGGPRRDAGGNATRPRVGNPPTRGPRSTRNCEAIPVPATSRDRTRERSRPI